MAGDPEVVAARRAREAEVLRMRNEGMTLAQIGEVIGVSVSRVLQIERDALMVLPLAEQVTKFRAQAAQRFEKALTRLEEVAAARHPLVSHGRLMRGDNVISETRDPDSGEITLVLEEGTGPALEDAGPLIAALAEARKQADSFARYIGANAPVQVVATGTTTVRYDIPNMPDKGALR